MPQSCVGCGTTILWYYGLESHVRASFVCIAFDGQGEIKSGAGGGVVGGSQAADMRLNDGAADPKSHAGAVNLGGKEGIKDLVRVLMGASHAVIAARPLKLGMIHS